MGARQFRRNTKLWEVPDIVEEISSIDSGDFELLELTDGTKVLVSGQPAEREKMKSAQGWEILRHDSTLKIPHDKLPRLFPAKTFQRRF